MPSHKVIAEIALIQPARQEPEVQLSAMVPASVRRAVRRRAEDEGTTVRTVLLRVLKQAGLADIDEAEILDRRTTPVSRVGAR